MPPNTVYVGRGSKFGNPASVGIYFMVGDPTGRRGPLSMSWCVADKEYADNRFTFIDDNETAVAQFKRLIASGCYSSKYFEELRGKNLACWCRLDQPCHADVLLEIANGETK